MLRLPHHDDDQRPFDLLYMRLLQPAAWVHYPHMPFVTQLASNGRQTINVAELCGVDKKFVYSVCGCLP